MERSCHRPESPSTFRILAKNSDLIEALQNGPIHKRDLASRIGVSSKTIYRRMRELQEFHLVERGEDGYTLTGIGQLHANLCEDVRRFSTAIYSANNLFSDVPPENLPPYWLIRDSETIVAQPHAPNQPVIEMETLTRKATHVKGLSPVVLPQYVELLHGQITSAEITAELVFEPAVVSHLQSHYAAELDAALDAGAKILETAMNLPFGLLLIEEPNPQVMVLLYGQDNRLNGSLRSDTPMAVEWASSVYRSYRIDATEVT